MKSFIISLATVTASATIIHMLQLYTYQMLKFSGHSLIVQHVIYATMPHIGGRSRGHVLLNFKTLHRNSIFVIENHLSLAKRLAP